MGCITTVDSKTPDEVVPVAFDFAALVAGVDSVNLNLTVMHGSDTNAAAMLLGSALINETVVTQLIRNGVDQAIYRLRADITSGSEKYSLAMDIPVRELK